MFSGSAIVQKILAIASIESEDLMFETRKKLTLASKKPTTSGII